MSIKIKAWMVILLLLMVLLLPLGAGCYLDINGPSGNSPSLGSIEEAWQIIFEEYVDIDSLDADALREAAIRGIIEELDDPYTSYVNAEGYQATLSALSGKYQGIGAYVGIQDERLVIIAPIAGSPADKAGIRAGDIIMAVDGEPTDGMNLEEAILLIRGPKGTVVRLLVLHQGETEPEEVAIIRDDIELPSIHFEMKDDIAYIQIHHFTERTDNELVSVLEGIEKEPASGIILDLRSNPGGLVKAVVDVTSHFIDEGVVLCVVDNKGEKTTSSVRQGSLTTDLHMVVLVDSYSASGSEVLAGALQDYERAIVAGNVTFGKGSVNTLYKLEDGSGMFITTARWLTPNGRLIEGEGITPDYILDPEDDPVQWAIDYLKGNQ